MSAIGVFDSGLGGTTVLKAIAERFPEEKFLYIGDTARLPYGAKSPETIRKYLEQATRTLIANDVKAVVVACNSASTQVRETVFDGVPIFNVIDPGVTAALAATRTGKIGILGTRATVESGQYQRRLRERAGRELELHAVACPLFVPLAEEGWIDDPVTNLIVYRYLAPLAQAGVDTVIMGCTHYPLLKSSIERVMGKSVALVDSGAAVGDQLENEFKSGNIARGGAAPGLHLRSTDVSAYFLKMAENFLHPLKTSSFEKIDLLLG